MRDINCLLLIKLKEFYERRLTNEENRYFYGFDNHNILHVYELSGNWLSNSIFYGDIMPRLWNDTGMAISSSSKCSICILLSPLFYSPSFSCISIEIAVAFEFICISIWNGYTVCGVCDRVFYTICDGNDIVIFEPLQGEICSILLKILRKLK